MTQQKNDTDYKLTDDNISLAIWMQPRPSNAHRIEVSKSICIEGRWMSTSHVEDFTKEELERRKELREHGFRWLELHAAPRKDA